MINPSTKQSSRDVHTRLSATIAPMQARASRSVLQIPPHNHEPRRRRGSVYDDVPIPKKPPTGIDTIHLLCREFSISKQTKLRLLPPGEGFQPKCYLWKTSTGTMRGTEALWRTKGICVIVRCPYEGAPRPICLVQITVPSLIYGQNANVVDEAEFMEALLRAQKILEEIGVFTDLFGAQPVRVDVCRNVPLPRPFEEYRAVFETWKLKYARQSESHDNGITQGNGSMHFTCYDKRKHLRIEAGIPEGSLLKAPGEDDLIGEHTMRLEYRLLGAKKIRGTLDLSQFSDNPRGIARIYNTLERWFDDQQKQIMGKARPFYGGSTDPLEDFPTWWQGSKTAIRSGEGKFESALAAVGYHYLKSHLGEDALTELQNCLMPLTPTSKNSKQNFKRRINGLEDKRKAWVPDGSERDYLFFELWQAIFADQRFSAE